MQETIINLPRIMRLNDVRKVTGLSRSTIYSFIRDNKFPAPIKLGQRAVGWSESSVIEWLRARGA
jgi:prophage regulatory protein